MVGSGRLLGEAKGVLPSAVFGITFLFYLLVYNALLVTPSVKLGAGYHIGRGVKRAKHSAFGK